MIAVGFGAEHNVRVQTGENITGRNVECREGALEEDIISVGEDDKCICNGRESNQGLASGIQDMGTDEAQCHAGHPGSIPNDCREGASGRRAAA